MRIGYRMGSVAALALLGFAPLAPVAPAAAQPAAAMAKAPPAKALKYHRVLLRRPSPGYVFDRFFNAWLDEATVAELETFLTQRVKDNGAAADGLLLAFFHAKQGNDLAAIGQFRQTLADDPGNAAAWYEKAVLEARTLDFETALADLGKAAAANPGQELAVRVAKLRGKLLVRSRKREEALRVFAELIAANPDDEELAEDVIELQVGEGLFDEAAASVEKLIQRTRDPYRRVLRRLRLGDIHQQAGKRGRAIGLYRDTLADVGAESWLEREILAQIERAYRREDDIAGLKSQYQELLEEYPRRVGVRRGYAAVLADSGEQDAAVEQFREVLKITPGDRGNQEAFVQLYLRAGKPAEARKQLEAIVEQNPEDGELYVQLAELAKQTDDAPAAAAAVAGYLQHSARDEYAYLRAARLLERLELLERAKQQYAALTERFPDSRAAKEARASFLYKQEDKDAALALWRAAAAGDDPQQSVRVARALAARQEHRAAYELLDARRGDFPSDGLFLGQLIDAAIALKKYDAAAPLSRRRVDLATTPAELDDAVAQAAKVVERGELLADELAKLSSGGASPTPQRACLLAELLERSGDVQRADATLAPLIEAGDLLAISQQVRLAKARRDWPAAITATRRLIDLPGGRKSRNVRRLVGFYERAYEIDQALEWVREWKKLSPGSTTPWMTEARLLTITGKEQAAVGVLREAAREFDGAVDVRTRLATLYQATGKLADAQRIYWREYEEGDNLVTKLRAVEQLARVAQGRGKVDALVANFEERRRANRESIEPLMALATIHRVANNFDKRLQALADAAKLRPDDVQLLRQIARVEEQEGDWERARDTLLRAMKADTSGRVRQQLAALYLRWGDADQGYALLSQSIDQQNAGPREAEQLASAMVSAADWERAREFLAPRVERWPEDYRLRFLLAVATEEEGDPAAAAPHFLAVLDAEAEPPTAAPAYGASPLQQRQSYLDQVDRIAPPGVRQLAEFNQVRRSVYQYRSRRNQQQARFSAYGGMGASLVLPAKLEQTQKYALVHLAAIVQEVDDAAAAELRRGVAASPLAEAEVALSLGAASNNNVPAEDLLERFPDRDAVRAYLVLMMTGRTASLEPEFFRDAVGRFGESHPEVALLAGLQGVLMHEELSGDADLSRMQKLLDSLDEPAGFTISMLCTLPSRLNRNNQAASERIPEAFGKRLRQKLVGWYPKVRDTPPYGQWIFNYMVGVMRMGEDPADYLALLDDEVARYRRDATGKTLGGAGYAYTARFARGRQADFFEPPPFPPQQMAGFPPQVLRLLSPTQQRNGLVVAYPGQDAAPTWGDDDLRAALPEVKDPTLRLLLANQLNDREVVDAAIKQLLASDAPKVDDYLLAAGWAAANERPEEAITLLEKARYLPMNRATRQQVDCHLVALVVDRVGAGLEPGEQLTAGRDAALRLRLASLPTEQMASLASVLEEFGLKEEAEALDKRASAAPPTAFSARPSYAASLPASRRPNADRIQRLVDGKKREAAAKLLLSEALALVRQRQANPNNASYQRRQAKAIRERIEKYGLADEVAAAADPGASTSHRRHADFAALLDMLGRAEASALAYRRALELRPGEDAYRVRLIVADVAAGRTDDALKRFDDLRRGGADLVVQEVLLVLNDHESSLASRFDWAAIGLALFEHQRTQTNTDLRWATTLRRKLAQRQYARREQLGPLYTSDADAAAGDKQAERRRELHDKLCRAMLGVDTVARDGFAGLLASHEAAGEVSTRPIAGEPDEELAEKATEFAGLARDALRRSKRSPNRQMAAGLHQVIYSYPVFNGTASTVPERTPGEYLVRYAFSRSQRAPGGDGPAEAAPLGEDLLPFLRENGNAPLADAIERYQTLYACPPERFPEAAEEFVMRQRRGVPGAVVFGPMAPAGGRAEIKVYEAYRDRGLKIDLRPVMAGFVKKSLGGQRGNQAQPFVIDYTRTLAEQEGDDAALAWLEQVAEVYAGPREKRAAHIERHFSRRMVQWNTPNASLHGLGNTLQQLLTVGGPALAPTARLMREGDVGGLVQNADNYFRSSVKKSFAGAKAERAIAVFGQFGLLADADELDLDWRLGGSGGMKTIGDMVTEAARQRVPTGERKRLVELLAERPDQTLGVRLIRCALADTPEARAELIAYVDDRLEQLKALPPARRQALAGKLAPVASRLKSERSAEAGALIAKVVATFNWIDGALSKGAAARAEKVLAAKKFAQLKVEDHEVDEWLGNLMSELANADPRVAAQVYYQVADLYEEASRRGTVNRQYSGPFASEVIDRVGWRLDRESPSTPRLIVAILRGGGGDRIAMTRWDLRRFMQPLERRRRAIADQVGNSKAERVEGVKAYYTWLKSSLGSHASAVMIPTYAEGFRQRQPEELQQVEQWLAKKAEADGPGGVAEHLLVAAQLARTSHDRRTSRGNAAAGRRERRPHDAYFERWLTDAGVALSERLPVASFIREEGRARLPLSTERAILALGAEACGGGVPIDQSAQEVLAGCAAEVADADPADPAVSAFRKAWVERFVKSKAPAPASRRTQSATVNNVRNPAPVARMLALCYRQGDADSARLLTKRYRAMLGARGEVLGLLVREGEVEAAARLLRVHWPEIPIGNMNPSPVFFDARLAANVGKLRAELSGGPLAYLAEAALARLPDAKPAGGPADERPPARGERMRAAAARFADAGITSPDKKAKALLMFRDDREALALVAGPLAAAAERIDLRAMAVNNSSAFEDAAQLVFLHASQATGGGDPRPLMKMLDELASDSNNAWRLHNAYRGFFGRAYAAWAEHLGRFDAAAHAAVADTARELYDRRGTVRPNSADQLSTMNAVAHARAGRAGDYKRWHAAMEESDREYLASRGVNANAWKLLQAGLEKGDPETLESRLANLTAFSQIALTSSWFEQRFPLAARVRMEGGKRNIEAFTECFSNEELPTAAPAVAEAAPGMGGLVWVLAADALEKAGAADQSAAAWGKAYDAATGADFEPRRPELRLRQIVMLEKAGKRDAAAKLCQQALDNNLPIPKLKKRYDEAAKRLGLVPGAPPEASVQPPPAAEPRTNPAPSGGAPADEPPTEEPPSASTTAAESTTQSEAAGP